jgi:phosphoserine phosphatase RsbU/P
MADVPTILLADDDPVTILLLEAMLRQEGYRTISASGGFEARRLAGELRPDLVLLDVQMPDLNGFDVCRGLKEEPETSHVPVLFVSAEDDVRSKVAGLDAGAVDYVTKPFHRAEVLARVRTHLRLARTARALVDLQAVQLKLATAQQAILPNPERWPEARFAVSYRPLHDAGGDFYDVIQAGEGVIDYLVADVSGHDAGSALPTSALKALLLQNCSLTESPAQILETVNTVLRRVLPDGTFTTLGYLRVNRSASKATYVTAAHPPAVFLPHGKPPLVLDPDGDVLGFFPAPVFEAREVTVRPGDRLFVLTDGLLELVGNLTATEQLARVCELCESHRNLPLADAVRATVDAVFGRVPPHDDIVLLGVEI